MDKKNLNVPNLIFLVLAVLFLFSGNISLQIVAVVVVGYQLLKGNLLKKSSNDVDLNNLKMSDAAVLFEKKYQEISELLFVYLEIYFKKAFETPNFKALNYPYYMHSTMAARVTWYLLGNDKDEINLNIDDKEKKEYLEMANKHVEKWAEDSMNADHKLRELVVQTLRLKYIFHSYAIGDIKYLKSKEYFFVNKLVKKFGSQVSKEPSLNNLDELIREWADWTSKATKLQNNKNLNEYQEKAKIISQILFRLVDKFIVSWLEDKDNTVYISKYNNVFVRLQMHIETLFYMMFFIDRFVFTKLGADKRGIFMDELIENIKREMGVVYKDMLDETEIKVDEIFSSYNYTIQTYHNARMKFIKENGGTDDLWIYGKTISKILVDNDTDFLLISTSFSRFAAFMKYLFWDEINLVFKDIN